MTDIINKYTVDLFLKLDAEFRTNKVDPYTALFDSRGTLIRETTLVDPPKVKVMDTFRPTAEGFPSTGEISASAFGSDKAEGLDSKSAKEPTNQELRRCGLPFSKVLPDDFLDSVLWVQDTIGLSARNLLACMAFETGGTFDPSEQNPGSSATGLIQFMEATARRLGTTTKKLEQMSQVQQMNYVFKYFREFGDDLHKWDYCDIYMAILYPAAIGKPSSYPVFVQGKGPNYAPNRGLDANRDGTVTKGECCAQIKAMLESGLRAQRSI